MFQHQVALVTNDYARTAADKKTLQKEHLTFS